MANVSTKTDVYTALIQKCGFEVLEEQEGPKRLRIAGRNHRDRWPFFLPVIFKLISTSEMPGNPWTCDISKKYLIANGKVLYAWRIIFESADLPRQYANIVATIRSAQQPARVELTSQMLPGYKPGDVRGGVNAKGKGVATAGTLPMALTRPRG